MMRCCHRSLKRTFSLSFHFSRLCLTCLGWPRKASSWRSSILTTILRQCGINFYFEFWDIPQYHLDSSSCLTVQVHAQSWRCRNCRATVSPSQKWFLSYTSENSWRSTNLSCPNNPIWSRAFLSTQTFSLTIFSLQTSSSQSYKMTEKDTNMYAIINSSVVTDAVSVVDWLT